MPSTLSVPVRILAEVHTIEGGGYWAEVPRFPGCMAQADTLEALREALGEAIEDWLNGEPVKTEEDARRLAEIQGSPTLAEAGPFPQPNPYLPPAGWNEDDE